MSDVSSWLDNWPTIKTFGPSMITGSVTAFMASLAYFVSRAQREIAANKYNLDLFDKRYPIYEEFDKCFSTLKYVKNEDILKENCKNIFKNKDTIIKCSRLFSGVSEHCYTLRIFSCEFISKIRSRDVLEKYINEYGEYFKHTKGIDDKILSLEQEVAYKRFNIHQSVIDEKTKQIHKLMEIKINYEKELEIYKSNEKMHKYLNIEIKSLISEFHSSLLVIYEKMEEQLNISHDPYKGWKFTLPNPDFILSIIIVIAFYIIYSMLHV